MQPFTCAVCGQLLFFHNTTCLRCDSRLGYSPDDRVLDAVRPNRDGAAPGLVFVDGPEGVRVECANATVAGCNWLVDIADAGSLCASCRLTTVRPRDGDVAGVAAFAEAEGAKRRLLHQLAVLGLPVIARSVDEERGVAFEFLSSRHRDVITGHAGGVITLDLSESDDAHREFVRQQLGEPYRTVLGHLRHEIGHYYWPSLVVDGDRLDEFRELFGDETVSYDEARADHYGSAGSGAGGGRGGSGGSGGGGRVDDDDDRAWVDTHVSRYATMHPWEDWAETFAHYLHIRGGLETADSFGIELGDPVSSAARDSYRVDREISVGPMVQQWLALTLALNGMSRSIGEGDHYPFVLSQRVIEKLDFVHRAVSEVSTASSVATVDGDR